MIRISKLNKTFNPGTASEVKALRDINLHILEGEFITIIGTNGSGKSTLLNAVSGTFLPETGQIMINAENVTRQRDFQRSSLVSRVFQNPFTGTAPDMSIAENIHMACLRGSACYPRRGLNRRRFAEYVVEVRQLEMQLETRLDSVIGILSGGQRQALTLLMAIITRPQVLLLDEHTAALDPKSAAQVIKLTEKFIERDHLTAMMVTHSMQQALDLGNRLIMMHKGKIIDDISGREKERLTVDDLLDKFAELRKTEKLTDDMIETLRREYV